MKHIKGLDCLRAIAIILVILDHSNDRRGPDPDEATLTGLAINIFLPTGSFGVNLFFVLSGFLITTILLNQKEQNTPFLFTIKNFFFRRALRIFPIYYLSLALLFTINYPDIRNNILWLLTYTSNIEIYRHHSWNAFSHSWSLSVEEQFYLIWPWIILLIPVKYIKHTMVILITTGIMSRIWVTKVDHGFDYLLVSDCADAFGTGGLYAYLALVPGRLSRFQNFLKLSLPVSLLLYIYWKSGDYFHYTPHFYFLSRTVDAIISISVIHYAIHCKQRNISRYIFENRLLIWIGTMSYGLYLYHYPIEWLYDLYMGKLVEKGASPVLNDFYIAFGLKLIILFCITYVSYEYLEKPLLQRKDRFSYHDRDQPGPDVISAVLPLQDEYKVRSKL